MPDIEIITNKFNLLLEADFKIAKKEFVPLIKETLKYFKFEILDFEYNTKEGIKKLLKYKELAIIEERFEDAKSIKFFEDEFNKIQHLKQKFIINSSVFINYGNTIYYCKLGSYSNDGVFMDAFING